MKILFMGNQKWACLTLKALLKSNHEVVGVIAETDKFDSKEKENYEGNKEFGVYDSLKDLAKSYNLKLFQPKDVNDPEFIKTIDSLKPDLISIVSYHSIIKKPLLEKYKNKIINTHGAPLPYYRGRAPINWAVINGEKETAVTVHFVDEGIDTGDIIVQERVPINLEDTSIKVLQRSLPLYPQLVLDAINQIEKGKVKPIKQSTSQGTYFPKRTPKDGLINWQSTSLEIYNFIRALTHPYPGAFTYHKDKKLYVWDSSLDYEKDDSVKCPPGLLYRLSEDGAWIKTKDSSLILKSVQAEGDIEKYPLQYFKRPGINLGIDLYRDLLKLKKENKELKQRTENLEKKLTGEYPK